MHELLEGRSCFILAIFTFPHPPCIVWDVALVLHLLTIEVWEKKKEAGLSDARTWASINPALSSLHSSGWVTALISGCKVSARKQKTRCVSAAIAAVHGSNCIFAIGGRCCWMLFCRWRNYPQLHLRVSYRPPLVRFHRQRLSDFCISDFYTCVFYLCGPERTANRLASPSLTCVPVGRTDCTGSEWNTFPPSDSWSAAVYLSSHQAS